MLAWIARLAGGISLSGWLLGGLGAAFLAYVAGSQVVRHRRQVALDWRFPRPRRSSAATPR